MKKLLLIVLISFLGPSLYSQTELDSILSIWNDESLADTLRLRVLDNNLSYLSRSLLKEQADPILNAFIQKAKEYGRSKYEANGIFTQGQLALNQGGNYTESRVRLNEALSIYREIEFTFGICRTLSNIGSSYEEDDPVMAIKLMKEAIDESLSGVEIKSAIGCSFNLSNLYLKLGERVKALEVSSNAVKWAEELQDKEFMAWAYHGLSHVYLAQGKHAQGNEFHDKVLKLYEELGDQLGEQAMLSHIAESYENQEKHEESLLYHERALALAQEMGAEFLAKGNLHKLATFHAKMGNLELSKMYLNKIEGIAESSINTSLSGKFNVNTLKGEIKLEEGQYKEAIKYCDLARINFIEINSIIQEREACQCLFNAYKKLKMGNEALEIQDRINEIDVISQAEEVALQMQQIEFSKAFLADSLATVEKTRMVEETHQVEVRQKNKTRNMLAGGGILVLILAGGIYGRLRYTRKSKAVLQVEKDRSENLLLNILPADIAAELKEKGRAEARDFDMASILFTDFKDFTAASEKLSAQELVAEINTCFEAFDGIMGKYNIEKIKTIGDAYMAAGGLPIPTDDSVKNTVLAALEMQAFIDKRKTDMDAKGLPAFEMRVGIHTGPVVAGIVGVKKFAYDIWGDTVNTASRMESSGGVGQVNISEATYALLKEDRQFSFESRGKIEAKGKGEIEMYFVSRT